jgi:hypothetical protein
MIFSRIFNVTVSQSLFVLGKAKRRIILHFFFVWQSSVLLRQEQMLRTKFGCKYCLEKYATEEEDC